MAHVLYIGYDPASPSLARVAAACQEAGHAHQAVLHGLDAIAALDEGAHDIVVYEAKAPADDAITLAQIIRERPRAREPHVIALVDGPTVDDQVALMAAGVDLVFDAHVSASAFERVFRRALEQPARMPGLLESVAHAWLRAGTVTRDAVRA